MSPKLQGEVVYLYAFDVADEIRTERISKILSKKAVPMGVAPERTHPKTIHFYKPLTIDPKRDAWKLRGLNVQPVVRVYDVGVVSIMITVPFAVDELNDLISLHSPILDNHHPMDRAAHELCVDVVHNLKEYLVRGTHGVDIPEAYTVLAIRTIEGTDNAEEWSNQMRREIAGLLSETSPEELSIQQVEETFRHSISFDQEDRTIIDWDAAMVIDLKGPFDDIIHVLELANLQLEELVLMDKRLDDYIDKAYEVLDRERISFFGMRRTEIANLRRFRITVAKITDEVSNISKFFGDWYLARIYLAARERFHLATWRESIHNRLSNLDNLYEVLRTETNESRMFALEVLIVLLFILDLVAVVFLKK